MNLLKREQIKYVFRPPRYSAVLAPFLLWLSEVLYKRRTFDVQHVEIEGGEEVRGLHEQGHMLLVAPNHADHADPSVMCHAGTRSRLPFHFMAAREVFEKRTPLGRWLLQKIGVFSVDREGADISAIKMAMSVLQEGKHPLIVFPEGEIFHHHERLAPLNEGVATILVRAMKGQRDDQKGFLVPTAIRYSYEPSIEDSFDSRLSRLEERITWKPRNDMDPVDRIYRLGRGLLASKEVEFLGSARPGALVDRIAGLQHALVSRVENDYWGEERDGAIPDRVKALRATIRKELTDDVEDAPERVQELYDDLDTLFLAVQLYSYPGQYLTEDPTRHRIAETLVKLEEDVIGTALYAAPRKAHVRFDTPIDVKGFLEEGGFTVKTGVGPLTELLAERIQTMLEEMTEADRTA